jgi:hypothetical protein
VIRLQPLDNAITYAAEHPGEFYMQAWFKRTDCGTTACLAGTIALQAGWEPTGWLQAHPSESFRAAQVIKGGEVDRVSGVAADILGLDELRDYRLLDDLFHAPNLAAVIRIRNRVAADQGVPERAWTVAR